MTSKATPVNGFQGELFMSNHTSKPHAYAKHNENGMPIEYSRFLDCHSLNNKPSQTFPRIPLEYPQPSDVESSEVSNRSDYFEGTGSEHMDGSYQMSPRGQSTSRDGSPKRRADDGSSEANPLNSVGHLRHVDFSLNDSLYTPTAGAKSGSKGFNFRQLLTPEYLEEREFDFKELLRKERNRAAAQRSNIKKKLEKEARKRELHSLQKLERKLRTNELELRRQNRCLRSLVYQSGYRLPTIQMNQI